MRFMIMDTSEIINFISGGNIIQKLISNSWGKHKANQYHDGDFIPDKTYWRQKEIKEY